MSYDKTVYWYVLKWYPTTKTFFILYIEDFQGKINWYNIGINFKFDLFLILFHYVVLQQYYHDIIGVHSPP